MLPFFWISKRSLIPQNTPAKRGAYFGWIVLLFGNPKSRPLPILFVVCLFWLSLFCLPIAVIEPDENVGKNVAWYGNSTIDLMWIYFDLMCRLYTPVLSSVSRKFSYLPFFSPAGGGSKRGQNETVSGIQICDRQAGLMTVGFLLIDRFVFSCQCCLFIVGGNRIYVITGLYME